MSYNVTLAAAKAACERAAANWSGKQVLGPEEDRVCRSIATSFALAAACVAECEARDAAEDANQAYLSLPDESADDAPAAAAWRGLKAANEALRVARAARRALLAPAREG